MTSYPEVMPRNKLSTTRSRSRLVGSFTRSVYPARITKMSGMFCIAGFGITAMGDAKGNQVEAARLLGIHPKYLHRLIKNLNLKSELKPLAKIM